MLLTNLLFSLLAVCSLGEVACYSDCSSIHSSDYSDYSANLGSGSDSDRCYPHTNPIVTVDYISTHTVPALLSFGPIGILLYCDVLHMSHISPKG